MFNVDDATYHLVYRSEGLSIHKSRKPIPFRYRVWLGNGLEPVCLVVMNKQEHAKPATRQAIRDAITKKLIGESRLRYFECVISSQRIITEVYFSIDDAETPRGEPRSLSYLERVLGLLVSVL
jgi:hypothetical protein